MCPDYYSGSIANHWNCVAVYCLDFISVCSYGCRAENVVFPVLFVSYFIVLDYVPWQLDFALRLQCMFNAALLKPGSPLRILLYLGVPVCS